MSSELDRLGGKPDLSSRCTCATQAVCHLHHNVYSQALWNERAYLYIKDLEEKVEELEADVKIFREGLARSNAALKELESIIAISQKL